MAEQRSIDSGSTHYNRRFADSQERPAHVSGEPRMSTTVAGANLEIIETSLPGVLIDQAACLCRPARILHGDLSRERAGCRRHHGPVRTGQSFSLFPWSAARIALSTPHSASQAVPRRAGRSARHCGGYSCRFTQLRQVDERAALRRKQVAALHTEGLRTRIRSALRDADFLYKCSDYYDASDDRGVLWNDPEIGIDWQTPSPILSNKDQRVSSACRRFARDQLPRYQP